MLSIIVEGMVMASVSVRVWNIVQSLLGLGLGLRPRLGGSLGIQRRRVSGLGDLKLGKLRFGPSDFKRGIGRRSR